ncbi:MAG: DUF3592 domain-containing protein [Cyclobacteriaceae bacterium]
MTERPSEKKLSSGKEENKQSKEAEPWMIFTIAIALIAVGIGFGYYKFNNEIQAAHLKEVGVAVKGIVMDESESGKSGSSKTHYFDLEYQWKGISYNHQISSKFNLYDVGEEVELWVDPENPEAAMGEEDMGHGSFGWAFIIMGLGGFIFWLGLKKLKEKKGEASARTAI